MEAGEVDGRLPKDHLEGKGPFKKEAAKSLRVWPSPMLTSTETRKKITAGATESEAKVQSPSRVQLFATPWTVARQAPMSMGFSRQGYWSGLPCPPLGDLPSPGSNLGLQH